MKNARVISTVVVVALLGAALALPGLSAANDGPPARIWDLVAGQEGQDVVLSFGVSPASESPSFTVRREPAGGGEGVDLELVAGDNLATTGEAPTEDCHYYSEPDGFYGEDLCQSHPELCVDCDEDEQPECFSDCETCPTWIPCSAVPQLCTDCDGDGEPECTAGCEQADLWEVIDRCVPPGDYSYTVFAETVVGADTKAVGIAVEDLGYADCADDPDDDGGPAEGPDGEGGGGGCAVTGRAGATVSSRPGLLPLLGALFPVR
jgi:hypothetical protein